MKESDLLSLKFREIPELTSVDHHNEDNTLTRERMRHQLDLKLEFNPAAPNGGNKPQTD